jgi:outer membrane protein assembly factor BamB
VNLQSSAFRGLQAEDRRHKRGEARVFINLLLDSGYIREPFVNATLFVDATDKPPSAWLAALGRALGVTGPMARRLGRRTVLALAATGAVALASLSVTGVLAVEARTPKPEKPGTLRWQALAGKLDAPTLAVGNGVAYVKLDTGLYALDAASGALVRRYATGGPVTSTPAVAGGMVVVGSYDSYVHAFTA